MKPTLTIVPSFKELDEQLERYAREREAATYEAVTMTLAVVALAVLKSLRGPDDHTLWLVASATNCRPHRPYIWIEPVGRHTDYPADPEVFASILLRTDDRALPVTVGRSYAMSLRPEAFRPTGDFVCAIERAVRETIQQLERNT